MTIKPPMSLLPRFAFALVSPPLRDIVPRLPTLYPFRGSFPTDKWKSRGHGLHGLRKKIDMTERRMGRCARTRTSLILRRLYRLRGSDRGPLTCWPPSAYIGRTNLGKRMGVEGTGEKIVMEDNPELEMQTLRQRKQSHIAQNHNQSPSTQGRWPD